MPSRAPAKIFLLTRRHLWLAKVEIVVDPKINQYTLDLIWWIPTMSLIKIIIKWAARVWLNLFQIGKQLVEGTYILILKHWIFQEMETLLKLNQMDHLSKTRLYSKIKWVGLVDTFILSPKTCYSITVWILIQKYRQTEEMDFKMDTVLQVE
jgi:hypothetical protein